MSEVSSTYKLSDFEIGKRYRIVAEGVVTKAQGYAVYLNEGGYGHKVADLTSIEKLPDPEPKWKHGTVVLSPEPWYPVPVVRDGESHLWRFPDGSGANCRDYWNQRVSEAWKAGTLQILYTPED